MLAVDGKNTHARTRGGRRNERAARHQRFFIRKRNIFSRFDRQKGYAQSRKARYGVYDDIRVRIAAGLGKGLFAARKTSAVRRRSNVCGRTFAP